MSKYDRLSPADPIAITDFRMDWSESRGRAGEINSIPVSSSQRAFAPWPRRAARGDESFAVRGGASHAGRRQGRETPQRIGPRPPTSRSADRRGSGGRRMRRSSRLGPGARSIFGVRICKPTVRRDRPYRSAPNQARPPSCRPNRGGGRTTARCRCAHGPA